MSKVLANSVEIYYAVTGSGPPLVLINGLTANIDWWAPEFLDLLAERHTLLLLDNRGAGRSDNPPGEYTIPLFAEDTAALMQETGFEYSHVFGLSMGGMIAQELALNHPDMVDRLMLCSSNCGPRNSVLPSREVIRVMMDRSGPPGEIIKRISKILFSEEWIKDNPEVTKDFLRRYLIAPISNESATRQFMATVKFDTYERLDQIKCPTLIITGTEDVLIPPENSEILAQGIPHSELIKFEGAGHGLTSQIPGEIAEAVMGFLGTADG